MKPNFYRRGKVNAKSNGFTLIELMIVIIILSVLIGVAIPAYKNYAQKARRSDAKAGITSMKLEQEKWRANNISYTSTLDDLGFTTATSPDGYYDLSITASGTNTYTVQAAAPNTSVQYDDTNCRSFTSDESDIQVSKNSSNNNSTNCW